MLGVRELGGLPMISHRASRDGGGTLARFALRFLLLVGLLLVMPGSLSSREFDQQAICEAIGNGWGITLWYKPGEAARKVLPRFLGYTRAQNQILNGWQISGFSKSGSLPGHRSFRLDRITEIEFTREQVAGPPPSGRLPSGIVKLVCAVTD